MPDSISLGDQDGRAVSIHIPNLIKTRLLLQANSGGGKSWTLRRILEQSFGQVQHLVIDPEGEFASLREQYDYILAGRGGDTPAEPRSAKLLARRLLELRTSAIIDIYELKAHERIRFVRLFLEALVDAPKALWHPVLVVVDEAHVYAPQKGEAESLGAVIDLATRGRKRGFCAILATQRIAKLHKDAAAELNNKLIGRSSLDVDMKRSSEELGFTTKEDQQQLRTLKPGEFFAFGPALSDVVTRITVGSVQTSHPEAGGQQAMSVPPATDKVRAILAKLGDLPAEAEQEARDIASLRTDNTQLRRRNTQLEKGGADPKEVQRRVQEATAPLQERVAHLEEGEASLQRLMPVLKQIPGELEAIAARMRAATNGHVPTAPKRSATRQARPSAPERTPPTEPVEGEPTRPQVRILESLVAFEPLGVESLPRATLAVFAGASPKSGGFFNNLGRLRTLGLIDYPQGGHVSITDQGRMAVGAVSPIRTVGELHDAWFRILPRSQATILEKLIEFYPEDIARDELAEMIGVSGSSGGYFNNLGRLRTLGAIVYPVGGRVQAAATLWPEGVPA